MVVVAAKVKDFTGWQQFFMFFVEPPQLFEAALEEDGEAGLEDGKFAASSVALEAARATMTQTTSTFGLGTAPSKEFQRPLISPVGLPGTPKRKPIPQDAPSPPSVEILKVKLAKRHNSAASAPATIKLEQQPPAPSAPAPAPSEQRPSVALSLAPVKSEQRPPAPTAPAPAPSKQQPSVAPSPALAPVKPVQQPPGPFAPAPTPSKQQPPVAPSPTPVKHEQRSPAASAQAPRIQEMDVIGEPSPVKKEEPKVCKKSGAGRPRKFTPLAVFLQDSVRRHLASLGASYGQHKHFHYRGAETRKLAKCFLLERESLAGYVELQLVLSKRQMPEKCKHCMAFLGDCKFSFHDLQRVLDDAEQEWRERFTTKVGTKDETDGQVKDEKVEAGAAKAATAAHVKAESAASNAAPAAPTGGEAEEDRKLKARDLIHQHAAHFKLHETGTYGMRSPLECILCLKAFDLGDIDSRTAYHKVRRHISSNARHLSKLQERLDSETAEETTEVQCPSVHLKSHPDTPLGKIYDAVDLYYTFTNFAWTAQFGAESHLWGRVSGGPSGPMMDDIQIRSRCCLML